MLLVEETKNQRLVGSTNEWVLDNYYMISEQEKVMRVDLRSREFRSIPARRLAVLEQLLMGVLKKCHYQLDKNLMFRYIKQVQVMEKDYLSYVEVCALLPLMKYVLIRQLAELCKEMEEKKAYHYTVTAKDQADADKLNEAAQENL